MSAALALVDTPRAEASGFIAEFATIDARLSACYSERARLEAALKRAETMAASADDGAAAKEVEQLAVKKRQTLADLLLGAMGVGRADVDILDAQARAAADRAEAARRERELAQQGGSAIAERLQPVYREIAGLEQRREMLGRQHVRGLAELAAREYRDAALVLGTKFARIQALANTLATLERIGKAGEVPREQRLSFQGFASGVLELPALPALGPLSDCTFNTLRVGAAGPGVETAHLRVAFSQIVGEIESELRALGIELPH